MSRHKAYALSPRDCLKTTLFQKWQRIVAPPGKRGRRTVALHEKHQPVKPNDHLIDLIDNEIGLCHSRNDVLLSSVFFATLSRFLVLPVFFSFSVRFADFARNPTIKFALSLMTLLGLLMQRCFALLIIIFNEYLSYDRIKHYY